MQFPAKPVYIARPREHDPIFLTAFKALEANSMHSCRIVASSSPVLRRSPDGGFNDQAAPLPMPSASTVTMPVSGKGGASRIRGRTCNGRPARENSRRHRRAGFPLDGRNVARAAFPLVAGRYDTLWRMRNAWQRRAMMGRMSLASNPPFGAPRRSEATGSHER